MVYGNQSHNLITSIFKNTEGYEKIAMYLEDHNQVTAFKNKF